MFSGRYISGVHWGRGVFNDNEETPCAYMVNILACWIRAYSDSGISGSSWVKRRINKTNMMRRNPTP